MSNRIIKRLKSAETTRKQTYTVLDKIGESIELASQNGDRFLDLYEYCCSSGETGINGFYRKAYDYNEDDLKELKRLGYELKVIVSYDLFDGYLWWKKKTGQIDFHRVEW